MLQYEANGWGLVPPRYTILSMGSPSVVFDDVSRGWKRKNKNKNKKNIVKPEPYLGNMGTINQGEMDLKIL